MSQYEGEWISFITNTPYPFTSTNQVPYTFILGITINNIVDDSGVYIKYITYPEIYFYTELETYLGKCVVSGDNSINPIYDTGNEIIGYIEIGANTRTNYVLTKEEGTLIHSLILYTKINNKTIPSNWIEGYNVNILVEESTIPNATVIKILPEANAGMGPYCGEPIISDAVYTINSIQANEEGKLTWTDEGYFDIEEYPESNTIKFKLSIPEVQLDCTRPGFPGPKGFDGPKGVDGLDGDVALELGMEFEEC